MVNRVIAAIISFVLPGIGQMIQGEYKNGFMIFILSLIIFGLIDFITENWVAEIAWFIIGIVAAYLAYQMPER
ncbi:hypothetical protein [uncultured Methanobrevibacter sp.]|uniref:hypothetical protein n=1 Tax=uncultured Methanobrevibacter sp. TaxID=253161 RepID=UPI0025F3A5AF|nr:hypothetical protein [uncultured Methanobrevibacter sp.]